MSLIGFLVTVLVILVVLYVVRLVVTQMGLPPPIQTVVFLIVGLVCLIALLNSIGVVGRPVMIW